jgi:membrane-associated phospholipid phosphatase
MSRHKSIRTLALVASVVTVMTACSDESTAPPRFSYQPAGGKSPELAGSLSSVGWQERARTLAAAGNMSPLAAARVYAALSVAQYRAVMSIETPGPGHDGTPLEVLVGEGRNLLEGQRGALAGASAEVLSFFFASAAQSLEDEVRVLGEATPGNVHPAYTRGVAVGRTAGKALVERAKTDGFTTPWTGSLPTGPGKWIANGPPAGATFGGVRPYFLDSGNQFRSSPPPAFGSAAFLADLNEIRTLSDNRTPEQRASAIYWNFPTGTFTPIGYWNLVATNYATQYGLDERAATRTFALVNASMMDALIGCWDAKYFHSTLRPSQADGLITLTFGLPNHPTYPSGHSCASAAAATVLASVFPDRAAEVGEWVTESGLSRMYAGIHFRFDITAGRELGEGVARWALAHVDRID